MSRERAIHVIFHAFEAREIGRIAVAGFVCISFEFWAFCAQHYSRMSSLHTCEHDWLKEGERNQPKIRIVRFCD